VGAQSTFFIERPRHVDFPYLPNPVRDENTPTPLGHRTRSQGAERSAPCCGFPPLTIFTLRPII